MNTEKLLQLCEETAILKQLQSRGYIERDGKEVIFTEKAEGLLNKSTKGDLKASSISVDEWIEDYRNLFPVGVLSGGYPVRGNKQSCITKMNIFFKKFTIKEYPQYTKEVILEATANYINRKEKEGFKYMQLSHYFIFKDGISNLASECDLLIEQGLNSEKTNPFEELM